MNLQNKTNWQKIKFGDVVTLHRGYDLPVEKINEGKYPVIFSNGKIEYHDQFKIKGPGVITGRSGALGNTFFINEDYWPHNTTLYVSDFHGNNPRFIYYLLKSLNFSNLNSGTGVPTLNRNHVHEMIINFTFNKEFQQKISITLSVIDKKIELNYKIAKTLEETAQTLFKEWFINFRLPESNTKDFIDSNLGKIPNGWDIDTLNTISIINPQVTITRNRICPFIEMKNLPEEGMQIAHIDSKSFSGSGSRFQNHDTLLARITPCLENGKTGYVHNLKDDEAGFGSTEFIVLRGKKEIYREFIYLLARSNNFRNYAIGNMVGSSGRQRVAAERIGNYKLVIPSEGIMEKFHELTVDSFQRIKLLTEENNKLALLRDFLLPKLMKGEIIL